MMIEKHFENIPEDWQIVNLAKLGKCINGLTYSPEDIRETGSLVLRSSNVQNDFITYDDNVYVREDLKFNPTHNGDILICVRNGSRNLIGKTARITENSANNAFGAFMTIYRSDENDFLNYFFKSSFFFREVHKNLGATINSINNADLVKFKVALPTEKERKAIADCLSTWDDAIEKQTKLIAAKQQRKKALMQQLLSGKKRLPGFTEAWKEVSIKEISSKKSSILQSNALVENSGSYKIYGATGVLTFVDFYEEENRYIGIVKDGSGVGNLFLCDGKSSVIATLDKILPKKNIDLDFLYQLFQTLHFGKYIVGGAIPHIYFRDYSNIHVNLPPELEQRAIGEFLKNVDLELNLLRTKLMFLKKQKVALMQQLLTAKVRLVS